MFKKIGIIGAGQMGSGIAQVSSLASFEVNLIDVSDILLQNSINKINTNMERQVKRNLIEEEDRLAALDRIKVGTEMNLVSDCDLVIEAATEQEQVKIKILKELSSHLKPNAIIATNTSSISITSLASATDRADKFIGMHFFNPVPVMKLVEIIPGLATDKNTTDLIKDLTTQLGKLGIISEDFPAFIVNRILLPMINEAVYTLHEGVSSIDSIDSAMKLGANHPMGPLELADFIGLDTCLSVMQVLHKGLADSKYRPCPLLVKYVDAGWLGRKTGRGFYDYKNDKKSATR
ncbi:MAG: 3-hydroxybutyryl-CoA dehydrogenase [Rhodospirillaceae bacterium]|nr:3-hydroxybutyryl-CoA dehydrogenase [Rhodospirillaceae bacterium]|tara:strand:+ start:13325 stop:14197 length:873 start_codon:yes stop_codon:yes gene_type:complete